MKKEKSLRLGFNTKERKGEDEWQRNGRLLYLNRRLVFQKKKKKRRREVLILT